MSNSLLVEYFSQVPEGRSDAKPRMTRKEAIEVFKHRVAERYNEGTLIRILEHGDSAARRAALLALGLLGTPDVCSAVAARLRDEDRDVAQMAADTLWTLWFRGDSPANNEELQRLARVRDRHKALAGLDALILRAPEFAEAYNQRAIVYFPAQAVRALRRRLRESAGVEPASLRRPGRSGSVLLADAQAPSGAQGVPQRPAHQPPDGRRRRDHPRPGERPRRRRTPRRQEVRPPRRAGGVSPLLRATGAYAPRSPGRETFSRHHRACLDDQASRMAAHGRQVDPQT